MKNLIPGQWIQAKCKQWFQIIEIKGNIVKVIAEHDPNTIINTHILEFV